MELKPPSGKKQCNCCPFGCHIDVDFVQYAAEAASLPNFGNGLGVDQELERLRQRSLRRTKILDDEKKRVQREQYYKNLLATESQSPENNQTTSFYISGNAFTDSAMDFYPASSPSISSDRNDNSSALFLSDSLENIMSDFDDAFTKSGGATVATGGAIVGINNNNNGNQSAAASNDLDSSFSNNNTSKMNSCSTNSRLSDSNAIGRPLNDYSQLDDFLTPKFNTAQAVNHDVFPNAPYQLSGDTSPYATSRIPPFVHVATNSSFSVPASPDLHNLHRNRLKPDLRNQAGDVENELIRHLSQEIETEESNFGNNSWRKIYNNFEPDVGHLTFPKRKLKSQDSNNNSKNNDSAQSGSSAMDFYDPNKNYYPSSSCSGGGAGAGACGLAERATANIENVAQSLIRMKSPQLLKEDKIYTAENDNFKILRDQAAALERIKELEDRIQAKVQSPNLISQKQQLSSELEELKKLQQFGNINNNNNFKKDDQNFDRIQNFVDEVDFIKRRSFKDNLKLYENLSRQNYLENNDYNNFVMTSFDKNATKIDKNMSKIDQNVTKLDKNMTKIDKKDDQVEYRTALGRAMSALGHSSNSPRPWDRPIPEPDTPRRTKSFDRMKELFSREPKMGQNLITCPSPNSNSTQTNSPSTANVDEFHSLRRPSSNSRRFSNDEYASDSEVALGDRHLPDRFSSLRRSRLLLRGCQNSNNLDNNSLFSGTNIASSEPPVSSTVFRNLNLNSDRQDKRPPSGASSHIYATREFSGPLKGAEPSLRDVSEVDSAKMNENICKTCAIRNSKVFKSTYAYTGPLPEPKPCCECENLRRKLLMSNFKPVTFNVSTSVEKCSCKICLTLASKTWTSAASNTNPEQFQSTIGILVNDLPTKSDTCEVCTELRKRSFVSFGINTDKPNLKSSETNTSCLEVASRKTNTDLVKRQDVGVKTDDKSQSNVGTMIDKKILLKYGYLLEKSSATENPAQYSVGFNTDLTFNPKQNGPTELLLGLEQQGNSKSDFEKASCQKCSKQSHMIDKSTSTQESDVRNTFVKPSTKNVGLNTEKIWHKNVFVSTEPKSTYDRYVDCNVKTKDSFTNTIDIDKSAFLRSTGTNTMATVESESSSNVFTSKNESGPTLNKDEPKFEVEKDETFEDKVEESIETTETKTTTMDYLNSNGFISIAEQTKNKKTNGLRDYPSLSDSCTSSLMTSKDTEDERNMVSSLVVEDDYENEEEAEQSDDEDLTYYTDEDDNEDSENAQTSSFSAKQKEKFDFTKPRPTRAFVLSKAAATKKLLTSSSSSNSASDTCHSSNFRRNTVQSRSVRLEKENKGDSLAYIAEKRRPAATLSTTPVDSSTSSVNVLTKNSSGLKDKVLIKKTPTERKNGNGNGGNNLQAVSPLKSKAPPKPFSVDQNNRKSLLLDEEKEEATDTLGPLPSELVKTWSTNGDFCRGYDNLGASRELFVEDAEQKSSSGRLVGNVVENLKGSESDDSEEDSDSEESEDEGSYDTNGNISLTRSSATSKSQNDGSYSNGHTPNLIISEALKQACEITNGYLMAPSDFPANVKPECAQQFLQHEWLKAAARKNASPKHVEEFLDAIEAYSRQLLHKVVNMCDQNENTALHYAVSHCNFDIVSLLLDTKVCNLNRPNKAGYTPVMLAALCQISNNTDGLVIQRLFQMGDVNIKASQHGQTALMLAVSHGKMETAKMLLDAGAGVNIQDEDGSTALMCAAEHGHKEIVRLLLMHPEIDASMADYDGSTALSIAVENGHKDIGVLIYAHLNYARSPSSIKSQSAPVWC